MEDIIKMEEIDSESKVKIESDSSVKFECDSSSKFECDSSSKFESDSSVTQPIFNFSVKKESDNESDSSEDNGLKEEEDIKSADNVIFDQMESNYINILPQNNDFNKKVHQCGVCENIFATNGNLKRHLKKHSGIKDFKCDVC